MLFAVTDLKDSDLFQTERNENGFDVKCWKLENSQFIKS